MGWLFSRSTQRAPMNTAANAINERTMARLGRGEANVSRDRAMRQSAAWACLRLRADLVSTMPVDVYRKVGGVAGRGADEAAGVAAAGRVVLRDRGVAVLDAVGSRLDGQHRRDHQGA
jgi:hypothetical protein